jgi:lipoate-protein ligase A
LPGADTTIPWRLIDTGPLDGPANMAVDEALLLSFAPEASCPLLRLYSWQPPALSLGRFQDAARVLNLDRCRTAGVPIVRRITGGGVIYHADELTYSIVCAPHHLPAATSIKESFRLLTSFLLIFYTNLGLAPRYAADVCPDQQLGERTPFCFAGKESYDILVKGKKIGGNAQRRLKEVIFQHGSIPLKSRAEEGGAFMRERPLDILEHTSSLSESGIGEGEAELKSLLAESFRKGMGVVLQEDRLTKQEETTSVELLGKYRDDDWNLRGEHQ